MQVFVGFDKFDMWWKLNAPQVYLMMFKIEMLYVFPIMEGYFNQFRFQRGAVI
jgi:hypothetical protein